jgi:8-oxo-dGTP pyrophosphatase MutT (NUDIX family)
MQDRVLEIIYTLALVARKAFRQAIRAQGLGVRGLVVRGDEVLLVRHRAGVLPWGLPGGAVVPHETLQESVQREVLEESGCRVQVEHLYGVFSSTIGGFRDCVVVFVCTPLTDIQPPAHDIEIAEARYVPLQSPPPGTSSDTWHYIAGYLRGERAVVGSIGE